MIVHLYGNFLYKRKSEMRSYLVEHFETSQVIRTHRKTRHWYFRYGLPMILLLCI